MRVDLFDFELPPERIALRPVEPREAARLLVVGDVEPDRTVVPTCPNLLRPGDCLVVNDTRVIPARLSGRRRRGDIEARIEATLHKREGADLWRAFLKPAKRVADGETGRLRHGRRPARRDLPRTRGGGRGGAALRAGLRGAGLGAGAPRRHAAAALHRRPAGRRRARRRRLSDAVRQRAPARWRRPRRACTLRRRWLPRLRRAASLSTA